MKQLTAFILAIMSLPTFAATPEANRDRDRQIDQLNQTAPQTTPQTPNIAEDTFSGSLKNTSTQTITFDDVQRNPKLAELLLNQALQQKDYVAAEKLLAVYQQWQQHDPILVDFAQGAIWRSQGKHRKAIALYQQILQKNPDLLAVRLDLAAMMFENQQIKDAQTQFAQAKQQGVPDDVLPRIQQYENAIDQTKQWTFSGSLNYTHDDNLNNASKDTEIRLPQFGNLPFTKNPEFLPQSGNGVSYGAAAERDFNVGGNHYVNVGANVDGVNYWDNHDYDDITARAQLGYRYKNLRGDYAAIPFAEKRWYGGEAYYNRAGVDMSASRWLNAKWRVNMNGTLAWKDYDNDRNGRDAYIGAGATYLVNAKSYVFGGINYGRDKIHHAPMSSSKRHGGYIGWGQAWGKQMGSRVVLNAYRERYDGNHYIFTDTRRRDNVVSSTVSLWHNRLSAWGVTPKLNWRYTKVNSNIDALHSYNKHKVFISFDKTF